MSRINVTVPDEQKEWLDGQPHLNASGLLQKEIREQKEGPLSIKLECPECETHDHIRLTEKPHAVNVGFDCGGCGEHVEIEIVATSIETK